MADSVTDKIIKLLAVARDHRGNENEASNALLMAQKLADAHNLELSDIGKGNGRDDKRINKGLYKYQRTLYEELSSINHCMYFFEGGTKKGESYVIRLLGSPVNVAATRTMADYIEDVCNRFVKDQMVPKGHHYFSKASHEFRDGMVDRLVMRIRERRKEEERERQRQRAEQQTRQAHPGAAVENAVVLMDDVKEREHEANYDYLHGEGAWAKVMQARKEAEDRYEKWLEERRQWKLDNPEEWEAQEAERKRRAQEYEKQEEKKRAAAERRRQKRIQKYGYDPKDYKRSRNKYDSDHYWAGSNAGNQVNLDSQIDKDNRRVLK